MQLLRRLLPWALFLAGAGIAQAQEIPAARVAPAPSQVEPPRLPAAPRVAPEIPSVQPPETPAFPTDAEKLSFVLLGFDIDGEFEEFVATSRGLAAPLIGKRVTSRKSSTSPLSCKRHMSVPGIFWLALS